MTRPAILDLDLVVVPREATDEMLEPTGDSYSLSTLWDAMLSASPYPTAPHGMTCGSMSKADVDRTIAHNATVRAEAADARIAELEKRLADAERVIEPFAAVEPMNVWHETEEDEGYHSLTENQFRAARAYMEGK